MKKKKKKWLLLLTPQKWRQNLITVDIPIQLESKVSEVIMATTKSSGMKRKRENEKENENEKAKG